VLLAIRRDLGERGSSRPLMSRLSLDIAGFSWWMTSTASVGRAQKIEHAGHADRSLNAARTVRDVKLPRRQIQHVVQPLETMERSASSSRTEGQARQPKGALHQGSFFSPGTQVPGQLSGCATGAACGLSPFRCRGGPHAQTRHSPFAPVENSPARPRGPRPLLGLIESG